MSIFSFSYFHPLNGKKKTYLSTLSCITGSQSRVDCVNKYLNEKESHKIMLFGCDTHRVSNCVYNIKCNANNLYWNWCINNWMRYTETLQLLISKAIHLADVNEQLPIV